MNKQIKELFEQAHIQPPETRGGQFAFIPPKTFSPEKFAELIVRECALVVFKKTGPKSALDVLEHFGVEE